MQRLRTPKNILVTGGAGFIGSAFIRYLLQKVDHFAGTVINYDVLTYAGNLENLKQVETDPRYTFQLGDIRNQALVKHICQEYEVDTIIHFAAESHVDNSISNPEQFLETNVMGTFHLLEVIRSMSTIHFHHVSTDEVYGCLTDEGTFTESTAYRPNSPYSASKAASDHLVRAYANTYGISTCISNCSNNYGPYQHCEKLIPLVISKCLEGATIPIYGKGANIRDWLFVEDHAEALWLLLCNGKRGQTYNIGGNEEWRNLDLVYELLSHISIITGRNLHSLRSLIKFTEDRPGHDYRYAIDSSKIAKEIGWKPRHSFKSGIISTIEWYLSRQQSTASQSTTSVQSYT